MAQMLFQKQRYRYGIKVGSNIGVSGHKFSASATFLSSGIPFTRWSLLWYRNLVLQIRLCLHEGHTGGLIVVGVDGRHHLAADRVEDRQGGEGPGDLPVLRHAPQLLAGLLYGAVVNQLDVWCLHVSFFHPFPSAAHSVTEDEEED